MEDKDKNKFPEALRKIAEEIFRKMQEKGIGKMPDLQNTEIINMTDMSSEDFLKKSIKDSFRKSTEGGSIGVKGEEESGERPTCMCDNCCPYEDFEKKLAPFGGKFYYDNITMNGKMFIEAKFWTDGQEEFISLKKVANLAGPKQEEKKEEKPKIDLKEAVLKVALNDALAKQDFSKVDEILLQIKKLKNS